MMPALRTLLRPCAPAPPLFLPRLLHAYCRHVHGDAHSRDIISRASGERQDVDIPSPSGNGRFQLQLKSKASNLHLTEADDGSAPPKLATEGLEKSSSNALKPPVSSRQNSLKTRSEVSVQHMRNAEGLAFVPASENKDQSFEALHPPMPCQAQQMITRSKCSKSAKASDLTEATSPDDGSAPPMLVTEGLEKSSSNALKPPVSLRQNSLKARSEVSVQHMRNAEGLAFVPAPENKDQSFEALHSSMPCQAQQMVTRSKCSKSAKALEELRRKISLLELEQVALCDATILRNSRAFKSTSFEHLAAVLKVLKDLLGSGEKTCRALAMNPSSLLHPVERLEDKLKVLADFETTEAAVRKILTHKHALPVKVESLHKKLSFLKEIGLNVEARNKLLCKEPHMPALYPEGSRLKTLDFFKSLGMTREKILKSVLSYPSLLWLSVDNLREKYTFFQQHLGFSPNEITRAICYGVPRFSMETIQARIKFLKNEGLSDSDAHLLISRQPTIITMRSEVVKRKLDFLLCEQKCDIADIVKYPICLQNSLQGRLIPRFKVLAEKGLCRVFRLSTILACSNSNFLKLIERKGQ